MHRTVFFLRGDPSPDMALSFVNIEHLPHLLIELRIHPAQASDTSICTVDLLIPNSFAAARTVALCAMIYSPSSTALSSTIPFKMSPPFYR